MSLLKQKAAEEEEEVPQGQDLTQADQEDPKVTVTDIQTVLELLSLSTMAMISTTTMINMVELSEIPDTKAQAKLLARSSS